jgi:hypothetical protein
MASTLSSQVWRAFVRIALGYAIDLQSLNFEVKQFIEAIHMKVLFTATLLFALFLSSLKAKEPSELLVERATACYTTSKIILQTLRVEEARRTEIRNAAQKAYLVVKLIPKYAPISASEFERALQDYISRTSNQIRTNIVNSFVSKDQIDRIFVENSSLCRSAHQMMDDEGFKR